MAVRDDILEELQALQAQQAALARRQAELQRRLQAESNNGGLANGQAAEPAPQFKSLWGIWKDDPPISDEDLEETRNIWNVKIEEIIRDLGSTPDRDT